MKINSRGFGVVEGIVIVAIIGLLGFAAYKAYRAGRPRRGIPAHSRCRVLPDLRCIQTQHK